MVIYDISGSHMRGNACGHYSMVAKEHEKKSSAYERQVNNEFAIH